MAVGNGDDPAVEGTELTPEDEEALSTVRSVARQVKLWRESAGLRQAELGAAIGYSEEMVGSVERCRRLPKPEFLKKVDEICDAGGKLAAMAQDLAEVKYPKKVRDLAKLEADAAEINCYDATVINGLLQTEDYARANFRQRRPAYRGEVVEQLVEARMGRKGIFEQDPPPLLTFVEEEAVLRRPIGGKQVMRRQLEHMLELAALQHVVLQVMPINTEEHAGLAGSLQLLKLQDGGTIGHNEVQLTSRLITNLKEVQTLEMRHGMIRTQALRRRESIAFIEKVLGET